MAKGKTGESRSIRRSSSSTAIRRPTRRSSSKIYYGKAMQQEQQTALVTPEEIIHLILDEMQAGMCPSFYSNLVPSTFHVYLLPEDLERLRPLEQRMRDEAIRA